MTCDDFVNYGLNLFLLLMVGVPIVLGAFVIPDCLKYPGERQRPRP